MTFGKRSKTSWGGTKVAEEKDTPWENKMKHMAENFTPAEWKHMKGASNGGYHYLGAAKIMAPIGKAFAEAIVDLLKNQPKEKPRWLPKDSR